MEPPSDLRFLTWLLELPVFVKLPLIIAFFGGIAWLALGAHRGSERRALAAMDSALPDPGPSAGTIGEVEVRFHTYHGFLVYGVQTEHRFRAAPDAARQALWNLHVLNCTRGLLAPGFLIIPLISSANYLGQKRSIARQEAQLPAPGAAR